MSTETIHCLIYRYNRIKERLRVVKLKGSQYIPLDEMEYKTDRDFFRVVYGRKTNRSMERCEDRERIRLL